MKREEINFVKYNITEHFPPSSSPVLFVYTNQSYGNAGCPKVTIHSFISLRPGVTPKNFNFMREYEL